MTAVKTGRIEMIKKQNNNSRLIAIIVSAVAVFVMIIVATVAVNFTLIRDVISGMGYRPTAEMTEIFDVLELTSDGQRIFRASRPELLSKDEFNQKCREEENESAILGCFTDEKIFVYDISDKELQGIRELTTAHELLHAVYHRMGEGERRHYNDILSGVFNSNVTRLDEELENYPEEQRAEELYVRAGTEIKNLPEEMERHFASIFKNQDKVVGFYESYITVFEEIERKMNELLKEINTLSGEVDGKISDYESRVESLNAQAGEFNECAKTMDCFTSSAAFNARRAELVAEQEALKALYAEINSLIEKHNALVVEYNENVLHGQTLNKVINSSEKVETD